MNASTKDNAKGVIKVAETALKAAKIFIQLVETVTKKK